MDAELHDHQVDKSETISEEKQRENEDSRAINESKGDVVVDIEGSVGGGSRKTESSKAEKVCRICHFGSEGASELIPLGCDCRGELGVSHHNCAEAWFSQKGNRLCEICGKMAKNIIINRNSTEDSSIFMMEWNEMRVAAATLDSSRESSRRCKKSFYNFLLGCLVLLFITPWLFRGMDLL